VQGSMRVTADFGIAGDLITNVTGELIRATPDLAGELIWPPGELICRRRTYIANPQTKYHDLR
jgi:hypothetical protein